MNTIRCIIVVILLVIFGITLGVIINASLCKNKKQPILKQQQYSSSTTTRMVPMVFDSNGNGRLVTPEEMEAYESKIKLN